jgi:hypothetical protein
MLEPENGTPIYIDVKHLDVRARLDYYILHDSLQKAWKIRIPIIYSHGAVSGERLKVAYHTSVAPLLDKYSEVKDPRKFYVELINRSRNYNCALVKDYNLTDKNRCIISAKLSADEFKLTNKLEDSTTAGWFYPWSINLFDEEIQKIYESDGIIGVMIDERTLGWNLPNYQKNDFYVKWLRDTLTSIKFLPANASAASLDSFRIAETFLRNMFYIVKYSGRSDSTAWNNIALGSDFDGFINPIDICKTADDVPKLKEYLRSVIPAFLSIHKEYQVEGKHGNLLYGLTPERALHKMFYENTRRFIEKYFDRVVRLSD